MKRIVCLILAITCVFALFSCGGKVNLDEVVAKATPTKVVTIVEYVAKSGETLTSEYVTEHDTKNGISAISYIYERFGEIEIESVAPLHYVLYPELTLNVAILLDQYVKGVTDRLEVFQYSTLG
jgi:hypothetical protein